jgi:uncharacterized protein (DUF433 family)
MSINSMIERTPGTCGGRARIAGTRVPVHRVAGYYRLGYAPEEILDLLDSLSLAQVHAALAYSLANPDEVEAALRDEEEALRRLAPEIKLSDVA